MPRVTVPDPRVVCLGLATLDVVHRVEALPRAGTKGWATSTELAAGGPALNAAVCAAHLLGRDAVTLVTVLGRGPAADLARADLSAHGVGVLDLHPAGTLPVASCLVSPDGERTVVAAGARASTARLTGQARTALRAADVLLVDGHHPDAATEAIDLARCRTVLDAGSAKPRAEQWLDRLDVVAGSADYARGIGRTLDGALDHVLAAGARAAVMTDGAAPARWATRARRGQVPAPGVDAVDTLGAGDAFHGALVAALALGATLPDAVARGCAVASVRVQHAGARAWLDGIEPWR